MPDILISMPRLTGEARRAYLFDELEHLAAQCATLTESLEGAASDRGSDLLAGLREAAELADLSATRPDVLDDRDLTLTVMRLQVLVRDGNQRCCALDLAQYVPAEAYALLEPSAWAIAQIMAYAYSRWAEQTGRGLVGAAPTELRYAVMDAVRLAIIDGALHARTHDQVPAWLQSEFAATLGSILDQHDMPTERERYAGPWAMKAAYDSLHAVAAQWQQRVTTTHRERFRRARSRSVNSLVPAFDLHMSSLPSLPTFADCFAAGHAYALVERVMDEVAEATSTMPARHLDAHLWFDMLVLDPDEELRPQ